MEVEHSISAAKLVVNGKILNPAETLQQANVEASNFIVVVPQKKAVAKPKPVEEPVAAPPAIIQSDSTSQENKPEVQNVQNVTSNVQSSQPQVQNVQAPAPIQGYQPSSIPGVPLSELELFESNLKSLTDMGFDREQSIRCLRAGLNDVNSASEFLLSGFIPEQLLPLADGTVPLLTQQEIQTLQRQQQQQQQSQRSGNPLANLLGQGEQSESPINSLSNQFQNTGTDFETIRRAIQQNPQLLEPILQSIQHENPEIFELIQRDPQAFIQLLNQPIPEQENQPRHSGRQVRTIQITPEEAEAIARLEDLGFDRQIAAQAYFACERDENAAANLLFDRGAELQSLMEFGGEDEEDQSGNNQNNDEEDDEDDDDDMDDA